MFYSLLQHISTNINMGLTVNVPFFKMIMEIWVVVVAIEVTLQQRGTNALKKQRHSPPKNKVKVGETLRNIESIKYQYEIWYG